MFLIYFTPTLINRDGIVDVPLYYYLILGFLNAVNEVSLYYIYIYYTLKCRKRFYDKFPSSKKNSSPLKSSFRNKNKIPNHVIFLNSRFGRILVIAVLNEVVNAFSKHPQIRLTFFLIIISARRLFRLTRRLLPYHWEGGTLGGRDGGVGGREVLRRF